ncbi:bifunctional glutamate N-acetyltransferase/amino-acid acetyltransferase ArgJ [Desulfobulbus elongatus]|uniref:bifunctional glutamate N-acetyltransferase/amino-acid acetyltransferase ArgJ n=1 Tax=Desulfobulbus elongatus TaxID=53332 RepID=UPI000483EA5D|nr:bifunctional glutamate N-acetyltransferase/amino-acid acetyltransferase ArgJ [Desulfobulbus elongatus]
MQVKGFSAAAVQAGIRYAGRLDLGLIFSQTPAVTAGAFTTNKVKAAPVQLDMERLRSGLAQAVLVNSGNANACTGREGMDLALATGALAAGELGIDPALVQVASTGVIGQQLRLDPFAQAMPGLVAGLSPDGFDQLARAIMTTDLVPKMATATVDIGGVEVSILGVAKGSGMIMPDMATMLCFVVTDAQIVFPVLNRLVKSGVEQTFNRITVDGDTSTNDTVLVMANGAAGNPWIDEENPQAAALFGAALQGVFKQLALEIVADGEGATKLVTVRVAGARDESEALSAAQTIANSALVKTAFFGEDANWGRIIAALGRSECTFDPQRVGISFDAVALVENGMVLGADQEAAATEVLRQPRFTVTVQLGEGLAEAEVYTCDFSYDYVKINADYRS